uniref:Serine protease n=1 Tax=Esox lucius TaxID=8010 RepID=A0A3P8ZND8_ESOLU
PENISSGIKPGTSKHSQDPDVKVRNTSNLVKKNLHKEVVIQRGTPPKAAVCTHFPCHLIDNKEELKIHFIQGLQQGNSSKAKCRSKQRNQNQMPATELITFCVAKTGGENIEAKVIKNPKLRKKVDFVCVYAYRNETVKEALRRDGRFHSYIFRTCCALSETINGDSNTDNVSVPDSQEDCDNTPTEEQRDPPGEQPEAGPSAQSSTPPETGNARSQRKEVEKDGGGLLVKQTRHEISNSKEILAILRSQFAVLVKKLKEREKLKNKSDVQQFFRKEFGKKTECFQKMKTLKCLIKLSDSVCQVRIEGEAVGTGFLLFDKFVLTNGHVVEPIYDPITNKLVQSVVVTFDFNDLTRCHERRVEAGVVVYEKHMDEAGRYVDFALLELSPDHETGFPAGLLSNFNFPTSEGGVALIGHPDGGVKKMDHCFITEYEGRIEAVHKKMKENFKYMQLINNNFLNWDKQSIVTDTNKLTYDTCFFEGASGSPAFNEHCDVVGMHTGGYYYKDKTGNLHRAIEFAIPLSIILENLLIQAVKRKRVDVLEGFLIHARQSVKLNVVMNRVEERSHNASLVQAFNEILVSNSNTSKQEEPRTFYQLLFEKVPGVEPMDVDQ